MGTRCPYSRSTAPRVSLPRSQRPARSSRSTWGAYSGRVHHLNGVRLSVRLYLLGISLRLRRDDLLLCLFLALSGLVLHFESVLRRYHLRLDRLLKSVLKREVFDRERGHDDPLRLQGLFEGFVDRVLNVGTVLYEILRLYPAYLVLGYLRNIRNKQLGLNVADTDGSDYLGQLCAVVVIVELKTQVVNGLRVAGVGVGLEGTW